MDPADRAERRRQRICRAKLVYPDIITALDELMIRRATPTSFIQTTYKCSVCHRWHMTSRSTPKLNPYPTVTGRWLVKNERGTFWVAWNKGEAESMASQDPDWWAEPELWVRAKRHGHKNRTKEMEQQWNT